MLLKTCLTKPYGRNVSDDGETSQATLKSLNQAITTYGKPREILSDNARAFTMQRYGTVGIIDITMAAQGILVTPGPFFHPQNQGKVERSHQPALKRLRAKKPTTPHEVVPLLAAFHHRYNHERQHLGLGEGITPANAWATATRAIEPVNPIDVNMLKDRYTVPETRGYLNPESTTRQLQRRGYLNFKAKKVRFGPIWGYQILVIIDQGSYYEFFLRDTGESVAKLYQPLPDGLSVSITDDGVYTAGDNKHLPDGITPLK